MMIGAAAAGGRADMLFGAPPLILSNSDGVAHEPRDVALPVGIPTRHAQKTSHVARAAR